MHRLKLLIVLLLSVSVLTTSYGDASPNGLPRVLLVETMPVPVVQEHLEACRINLEMLGWEDGVTASVSRIEVLGDFERAVRLLQQELDSDPPTIVITFATLATQAARQVFEGTGIPVVFSVVADPVGSGIIDKVGVPSGTNIAGLVYTIAPATMVEILMDCLRSVDLPRPISIGMIHSDYPSSVGNYLQLQQAAMDFSGIEFLHYTIPYRTVPQHLPEMLADIPAAVAYLEPEVDFWWESRGALGEVDEYHKVLMRESGKPIVMANTMESVRDGALMTITPTRDAGGQETAQLADRILRGEDPGSIPINAARGFRIGVNLKTALKLGVVFSPEILNLSQGYVYR